MGNENSKDSHPGCCSQCNQACDEEETKIQEELKKNQGSNESDSRVTEPLSGRNKSSRAPDERLDSAFQGEGSNSPSLVPSSAPSWSQDRKSRTIASMTISYESARAVDWEDIVQGIQGDPVGLYLIFDAANDGSWLGQWSKTYIAGSFAFARPGNKEDIPPFKYKAYSKEKFATGAATSPEKLCCGYTEYIKAARKFKSTVYFLEPFFTVDEDSLVQKVLIGLHNTNGKVTLVSPTNLKHENLHVYDAIAVVAGRRGPGILHEVAATAHVSLPTFASSTKPFGDCTVFLEEISKV